MPGYFGTEIQQRLQAHAESAADWIQATAGACQSGRFMGCDDPDKLGWDVVDEILKRDRIYGFRMIPVQKVDDLVARFAERGFRMDFWDVFTAGRPRALEKAGAIVGRGLPDGLADLRMPTEPEGDYTVAVQAFMAGAGIVPFSGSMLTGDAGPSTTVVVGDGAGSVLAAAHGYLPHNRHSPYHRHAWGGLVAVAESQRGRGLGSYINARMILKVFSDLDADHIYELVTATNAPSRRMVESCGLRLDPSIVCGVAMPGDSGRFTR